MGSHLQNDQLIQYLFFENPLCMRVYRISKHFPKENAEMITIDDVVKTLNDLIETNRIDKFYYEIKDLQDSALESKADGLILAQKGIATRTSKIDLLKTINSPVLFIIGKQDSRIQLDVAIAQASFPKHSEILILENVGHMGHIESREIIKQRLLSFTYSCFAI